MNASSFMSIPAPSQPGLALGRVGRCRTDVLCDLALSGRALVMGAEDDFLCPLCGAPLEELKPKQALRLKGRGRLLMAAHFALALGIGLLVAAMELFPQPGQPAFCLSRSGAVPAAASH